MAIEVNGVTLPDIPVEYVEKYPYYVVFVNELDGNVDYVLCRYTAPTVFATSDSGFDNGSSYDIIGMTAPGFCVYTLDLSANSWVFGAEMLEAKLSQSIGNTSEGMVSIVYTNHDIMYADSYNGGTLIYTAGNTVYMYNSEITYATEYRVPTDDLLAIADQVRRLTGNSGKLTTEQMGSELSGVTVGESGGGEEIPSVEGVAF